MPQPQPDPQPQPTWYALTKPSDMSDADETRALCTKLGQRAKLFRIERLIVGFEGLASFDESGTAAAYALFEKDPSFSGSANLPNGGGGYVLHGLLAPLLAKAKGKIEISDVSPRFAGRGVRISA
ncbi:MAG: hypothetical protein HC902_09015 [Calothrix sp. SM1_5_4]|nr:hypothetical protein [Calothrix sp. SM1_5_4]